jgi:hypothetical protein
VGDFPFQYDFCVVKLRTFAQFCCLFSFVFRSKPTYQMKPTFRPVVYAHHKRKDGTFNVKINIYYKGKERRLPTNIYCTKDDLTRTHHIKSVDILSKCNVLISKMQNAISDISIYDSMDKDVDWLVERIKNKLMQQSFSLDFFVWADQFLSAMKPSTRKVYTTALNALERFLNKRELDINAISRKMMLDFVEWAEAKPKMYLDSRGMIKESKSKKKKGQQAARYIAQLSAIFSAAKAKYNDEDNGLILIPRSPFSNIDIQVAPSEGQKPLSPMLMQRIILEPAVSSRLSRFTFDLLVVSFALRGANIADLWEAKPPKNGVWVYHRQKTKDRASDSAELRVNVPDCIAPYLERLGAGKSKDVWLPEMRRYKSKDAVLSNVNVHLKIWCRDKGIDEFSTYAVRKTWATLARRYEDKSIANEAMGHSGGNRMLDIYAEKPYERYHDLSEKVLDLFWWE